MDHFQFQSPETLADPEYVLSVLSRASTHSTAKELAYLWESFAAYPSSADDGFAGFEFVECTFGHFMLDETSYPIMANYLQKQLATGGHLPWSPEASFQQLQRASNWQQNGLKQRLTRLTQELAAARARQAACRPH